MKNVLFPGNHTLLSGWCRARPQYEHTAPHICSQGADGASLLISTLLIETRNTTQLGEPIYTTAESISNLEKKDPLFEFDVCDTTEL